MKTEEALEQISYIKDLLSKSRLKACEGYPIFLLVGIFWFAANALMVAASYFAWLNYLWILYAAAAVFTARTVILRHKWLAMDIKLLKQLREQCIFILIMSVPVGVLLFLSADWAFKAYIPFQVGLIYMAAGVFIGRDLKIIGFGMAATSLASLLMPYPIQDLWLGVVGGGGLIVTGMIFRNQVKKIG